jgi:Fe-Mn family superoxide dismutase
MPSATEYQAKPLAFAHPRIGLSEKTTQIHHDKLYIGYVNKLKEIAKKITEADEQVLTEANASYSPLRALRDGETFAANAVLLHEHYFETIGGTGAPQGPLLDAIKEKWGTLEQFISCFSATGMAVRGWVVLAWDTHLQRLKIYGSDAHNQGGVWSAIPLLVLDVYEHAYFLDYGSDRKAYLADFWKNVDWEKANNKYSQAKVWGLKD